jgi:2-polyprenyl-6-hydroxyphenyl methylase/3-demethylubiquinone-9 3-methyltransferase
MSDHASELRSGERFAFGKNWWQFLEVLNEDRIAKAERSLLAMLEEYNLEGRSFLDIGCGSGLISLAARRLGAAVHSFDYDPQSVACTQELRRRYLPEDSAWTISSGSVLERGFMSSLGKFDIVYSWGVLHHTGAMWQALELAQVPVAKRGKLFIAIYNDQGRASKTWLKIKRAYNRLPHGLKFLALWPAFLRLWGPTTLRDFMRGRPFQTWRTYGRERGMSPWRDVVDWVGGYPFEVAKPEEIFDFYHARGFSLLKLKTCAGGHGCNEFVFEKR